MCGLMNDEYSTKTRRVSCPSTPTVTELTSHSSPVTDKHFRPRRSRSAAAYSHQTFPWTICRSVRVSVRASVCPVHCGITADRIRMLFGIVGWTDPGMRQVVGFKDRSTGRGTFGGEFRAGHCNQCGLYGSTCATVPRRGPLPKLLWADLF